MQTQLLSVTVVQILTFYIYAAYRFIAYSLYIYVYKLTFYRVKKPKTIHSKVVGIIQCLGHVSVTNGSYYWQLTIILVWR